MRYSRVLTVLGLVAAVTLAMLLLARPSPPRVHPVRTAATTRQTALRLSLRREVQQLLSARPPAAPLALAVPEGGGTCFVAGGGCSLTPCVIPVQGGSVGTRVVSAVAGAVVARPVRRISSGCPSGSLTPRSPLVAERLPFVSRP